MEKGFSNVIQSRFTSLIAVFLFSIFFSSLFEFKYIQIGVFLFLLGVSSAVYTFWNIDAGELRGKALFVSLAITVFACGVFRYGVKDFYIIDEQLLSQIGNESSLEMMIVAEPVSKGSYREYVGETVGYEKEKVIVRADPYPEFTYGDKVLFQGTLKRPEVFETESGRPFDYPSYLSKDDIFLTLSFAKGKIVSQGNGNFLKTALLLFKKKFIEKFENSIPEPESSLLSGVLLGKEDSFGKDWEDKFRRAGVSHIMVLSGYNITLVAESVLKSLSFLPLRAALFGSSLGIVLFTIAVGWGASVLRASCMALLVILARATGRTYLVGRGLLLAGSIMIFMNPKILVFDFGFQLSFLATAALIWVSPLFESYLKWCPKKWNMREILSATLATQITVLPLLLYTTGTFSLLGIPVNMLILPLVPMVMFFGFVTGAVGFFGSWFAFPFGVISQFLLSYILKVVELSSNVQFLTISLRSFSWLFLVTGYGLLGYLLLRLNKKHK